MKTHPLTLLIVILAALPFSSQGQLNLIKLNEDSIFSRPVFENYKAPCLVETGPNELMLSFCGSSSQKSKQTAIWLMKYSGKRWSRPFRIAEGSSSDSIRYICSNPVMFRCGSGKMFLFYKVSSDEKNCWGMLRTSDRKGKKWFEAARLPEGVSGPFAGKPSQLKDGTIMYPLVRELPNKKWGIFIEKTCDQGKTWSNSCIDSTCAFPVVQSNILCYNPDKIQMICRGGENYNLQCRSDDNGSTWMRADTNHLPGPYSEADIITLHSGWQLMAYCKDGQLKLASSRDGLKWQEVAELECSNPCKAGFPSLLQTQDGNIHVTFTNDQRNIKHIVFQERRTEIAAL
ncbi:exo-alpha-sialidase [Filimonas effusa]|nr:exo-alpha-sialidase [Filimonas effusa]